MAVGSLNRIVEHLRSVLLRQETGGPDADLLNRFAEQRDEAAFEALVKRHGPMVMGVCLRVLQNAVDAEDAFQAVFLVLVRKASTIRPASMVGNWLYGVAYRTALKARAATARRRTREANVAPRIETPREERWDDLRPILDQELERLPEKFRAVLVHCDLEGKTRKEVAGQLGWPEGTVAGRLAIAREMLAKRLARHGFGASAGVLAMMLGQNASACVSPSVVSATVKAGMLFAAGQTVSISATVVSTAEGVLQAMFLTRLKIAAAALLILAMVILGGGFFYHDIAAAEREGEQLAGRPKEKGDVAKDAWSKPLNGLQGRLVRYTRPRVNGTEIIGIALELENVSTEPLKVGNNPFAVSLDLFDSNGRPIQQDAGPRSGPIGKPQWGILPRDCYMGFSLYDYGIGIPKDRRAFLSLFGNGGFGKSWVLEPGKYTLRGSFSVRKTKSVPDDAWLGQLDLPPLEIEVP